MGKGSFHVYRSSAGSGKTYTLVKEYLKLVLLNPEKTSQILAVTFTNAAAAEMKRRIIKELYGLSMLKDNPTQDKSRELFNRICEDFKNQQIAPPSESQIIENAKTVLIRILHNYSDFSISTIDSFLHRVVRTFAFDLGVPLRFETELESASLLSKAVDLLISRAGTDTQLTKLLISFLQREADEDKSTDIETSITKLAKSLFDETSGVFINQIKILSLDQFHKLQNSLAEEIKNFEKNAQQKAREAIKLINHHHLSSDAFFNKEKGIYGYFMSLSEGKVSEKIAPGSIVLNTIQNDKWYIDSTKSPDKAAIDALKPALTRLYYDIVGETHSLILHYKLLKAVNLHIFPVGVINEIKKILDQIKDENSLLHISDFNRKISDIIAEQPVPFIYERLGERYQHYMIDEFQDTSALQWQNLLPLIENGLSTGQLSLVVGDGKQAIYRWRDGDVEQFVALPALMDTLKSSARQNWENTLKRNYQPLNLNTNFRTRQEIVNFNNGFFGFASRFLSEEMKNIYREVCQETGPNAKGGYVETIFAGKDDLVSDDDQMVQHVIEIIGRLIRAGHAYKDITILCRTNQKASLLARCLLQHNIPVITAESLLLSQSPVVIFIISLLKLLHNRHDSISGIEAMSFLINAGKVKRPDNLHQGLAFAGIFSCTNKTQPPCWQKTIDDLLEKNGIRFKLADLGFLSLTEICATIVNAFFTDERANPFVAFFLDAVYEFSEKNPPTIIDFLKWWANKGSQISLIIPEGTPAVQIMTIHKAKGLEFPVVIFPFADFQRNKPGKDGCWIYPRDYGLENLEAAWIPFTQKHLKDTPFQPLYDLEMDRSFLDRLNMAYVAFTRPKEKLFVICKEPEKKQTIHPSLSQMLKEYLSNIPGIIAEGNVFRIGEFESASSEKVQKHEDQTVLERLYSREREGMLKIQSRMPYWNEEYTLHRDRGKILHKVMESIRTIADLEPVLEGFLIHGTIDKKTKEDWLESLTELLSSDPLSPCFSEGVLTMTEPGIFDHSGNFFRPDRVVFFENHTVVIDYKTGHEQTDHVSQIEHYAKLLQAMGYQNIIKILVYPDQVTLKIV
ncbi:MAG TPA: UvrD-helicase domain-containing protein [Bacteroidales bacterium]|nr:UvrD-helicase domain-containing protein [Bacteroidales bacterium]